MRPDGGVAMVDVGAKAVTVRGAHARANVRMPQSSADALRAATLVKGDAFAAAQIAGIFAAKQTAALIPLAHPLPLASVEVTFTWSSPTVLQIDATARTSAQTGVEMEAMVAASIAALTIYDMTKSLDKGIAIENVRLLEKSGGKSGTWRAPDEIVP
ncbi:MAG: cyclic pyranopterin monophosphate synthase MoaC [Vulcanimicrobiaceae bacterium]